MKKKMIATLLVAVMGLSLSACGGSSAPAEKPAEATSEAATETAVEAAPTETASEATDGKVWVVATDTAFKPFEYTNDAGDFVGIDVDILAAVAEDQGFKYELQVLGWDASIAACQAGQADAMIAGASITEERKNSGWIFSDGYYDANQSMAVKTGSGIADFDGLKGGSVAVKTGTMSASYAESLAGDYDFTVVYFEDSPTMYQAVVGGQVLACFDDTPIMASNIKDTGIEMEIVEGSGNDPAAYGLAVFNADNQEFVDTFNAGLANIKANGTYDEILAKYLGE